MVPRRNKSGSGELATIEEDALDIERLSINCRISLKFFKIKSSVKDPSVIKSKQKNMIMATIINSFNLVT